MHTTRQNLLKTAAVLLVDRWASAHTGAFGDPAHNEGRKIIVVACGGIRPSDTFSAAGLKNIPHLDKDLMPQSVFYPWVRNVGVTSHCNTTSSILTGNWQRLGSDLVDICGANNLFVAVAGIRSDAF